MVCIADPDYKVDLTFLRSELLNKVANYARPQFIRLSSMENIAQTETFKFKKVKLRADGFDPRKVIDGQLYFNKRRNGCYEVLYILAYQRINDHNIRF